MKISSDAIVTNIFASTKRPGTTYYGFQEFGREGQFSLSINGQLEGVTQGSRLQIEAVVTPRKSRDGGIYLSYESGTVKTK